MGSFSQSMPTVIRTGFIGFSVLDEATSQIGLEMEKFVYETCKQLEITVVSVGHRDSLRQFHDVELHINAADGSWQLSELHTVTSSSAKNRLFPFLPFMDFDA